MKFLLDKQQNGSANQSIPSHCTNICWAPTLIEISLSYYQIYALLYMNYTGKKRKSKSVNVFGVIAWLTHILCGGMKGNKAH